MARLRAKSGLYDRGIIAQASAPGNGYQGQLWFNNATGVLYQYMHDGATNFWLDISSGGIGTSASRSVDFVGDTDPHLETNGTGLAVGSVYYNREADRYFVCTTATTNANAWIGRYAGSGGAETIYKDGSDFYRVHTFLGSGSFYMDASTSCDIFLIGGGGSGGAGGSDIGTNSSVAASGGGAGGMIYQAARSVTGGTYAIGVGAGGLAARIGQGEQGQNSGYKGGDSTFGSLLTAKGGGGGGGAYAGVGYANDIDGGCGGGDAINTSRDEAGTASQRSQAGDSGTYGFGNNGGDSDVYSGAGGGGVGAVGAVGGHHDSASPGAGGVGLREGTTISYQSGTATFDINGTTNWYGGGGGGGDPSQASAYTAAGGVGGGGNGASQTGTPAGAGSVNTGSGGGGGAGGSGGGSGAAGGSGIVIIRYQLNA